MSELGSVRFEGLWTKSVETQPYNEKELVKKVISSFIAARKAQANVAKPYQPSGGWRDFLAERLKRFYEYASEENYEAIAHYLRNFFRNEAIAGLWSSSANVFQDFCTLNKHARLYVENLIKKTYIVWRKNLPSVDLKELDAPHVGNPFGYRFNDCVLIEPVFEYNFQAHYFDKLLTGVQMPVCYRDWRRIRWTRTSFVTPSPLNKIHWF